jgi:hypothetical protein
MVLEKSATPIFKIRVSKFLQDTGAFYQTTQHHIPRNHSFLTHHCHTRIHGALNPPTPRLFLAWCLNCHRDNFTFCLYFSVCMCSLNNSSRTQTVFALEFCSTVTAFIPTHAHICTLRTLIHINT